MSDRFGMTGNYLVHSAKGSTWEKRNHKYVSKKLVNGKWVYKYTPNDKGRKIFGSDPFGTDLLVSELQLEKAAEYGNKLSDALENAETDREKEEIRERIRKLDADINRTEKAAHYAMNGKSATNAYSTLDEKYFPDGSKHHNVHRSRK